MVRIGIYSYTSSTPGGLCGYWIPSLRSCPSLQLEVLKVSFQLELEVLEASLPPALLRRILLVAARPLAAGAGGEVPPDLGHDLPEHLGGAPLGEDIRGALGRPDRVAQLVQLRLEGGEHEVGCHTGPGHHYKTIIGNTLLD